MTGLTFDAATHTYHDAAGVQLPNITSMLEQCGLVDTRWYTDEARRRGTIVHNLTRDYDLGAIGRDEVSKVDSPVNSVYLGWLQGYIDAMDIIRPEWEEIEQVRAHAVHRFAGRPDRVGRVYGALAVVEIKSGAPEPAHAVQLALQAILVAPDLRLPAESLPRYAWYGKGTGKWKLESFPNTRKDFATAHEVIRRCCR